jgi:hypothetical protein
MRKFPSILIGIVVFIGLSLSCESKKSNANKEPLNSQGTEKKGAGRIEFVKKIHNFGSLKAGEVIAFTFVFKNAGESPLQIIKCESSCGCIEIQYNKEAIEPGQKSGIEVVFNTAGEWGNQIKTIKISSSSGEEKELTIGAYIENENFSNLINN